jgi:hypothetical protein
MAIRDKAASADDCRLIRQWTIERIMLCRNCIVQRDAKAKLGKALAWFTA